MTYLINSKANTSFITASGQVETIGTEIFERALADVQLVIESLNDIPVDVFSILGMRNLSAFIGELFAKSLVKESENRYVGNPHQDGYPDLLLMDAHGLNLYEDIRLKNGLRDKFPFSPFANGGLEIKATCGDVPTPAKCAKLNMTKPHIGDTRISLMTGYTWKAHHRETNNLVGILWDFFNGVPKIVAVFFGSDLSPEDWGAIVQPKEGGGRTTSVSIMKREGIGKMYRNWIAVEDDRRYIDYINRYNRGHLI
ncbi:hypothetical protein [Pseudomonas sp. Leaf129]|uniref:hypothetical protein n=1 Tax=Pseudomonas sp. Leaf129 TaxID=1736268 RepID=UPI000A616C8F|nr:hypothetical protein [Pseudomonas sp. Leaf129]